MLERQQKIRESEMTHSRYWSAARFTVPLRLTQPGMLVSSSDKIESRQLGSMSRSNKRESKGKSPREYVLRRCYTVSGYSLTSPFKSALEH